jgi:hypothetical protein
MLNRGKLKTFASKSGTRQGCLFLPFLFNRILEILASAVKQEKEIQDI